MSDIVEKLRDYVLNDHERGCQGRCYDCFCGYDSKRDLLMGEAADEIEMLRAALEWIAETTLTQPGLMVEKARAALEGRT